jgi:hypothetical protein
MIDFIFSEEQYQQLKQAYNEVIFINNQQSLIDAKSLIYILEQNIFRLPPTLHRKIKNNLNIVGRLLNIIIINSPPSLKIKPYSNPLYFIKLLSNTSQQLTSNLPKSPYQIICLKANNLILNCIEAICDYFLK